MPTTASPLDLPEINTLLDAKSPPEIVAWAAADIGACPGVISMQLS